MAAIVSDAVCPGKVTTAGEHLVEHAAEGPDVGPLVDHLAARLLRAHIGRRAEHGADAGPISRDCRAGGVAFGGRLEGPRQTEVEQLHGPVRPQGDVGGLQIAVHDALLVRGIEPRRHLLRDGHHLREAEPRGLGGEPIRTGSGPRPVPGPAPGRPAPLRGRTAWQRSDGSAPRESAPRARIAPALGSSANREDTILSATSRRRRSSRARTPRPCRPLRAARSPRTGRSVTRCERHGRCHLAPGARSPQRDRVSASRGRVPLPPCVSVDMPAPELRYTADTVPNLSRSPSRSVVTPATGSRQPSSRSCCRDLRSTRRRARPRCASASGTRWRSRATRARSGRAR